MFTLSGVDDAGAAWITLLFEFGGIGARDGSDGPDATGAFFLGGRSVIPQIEPLESQYPFVVRRSRLLPDSGGPGTWRGGLGVETEIELLVDTEIGVRGDRMLRPAARRAGRRSRGAGGSFSVERGDGTVEHLAARQAGVKARGRRRVRAAHLRRRRPRPGIRSAVRSWCSPTCSTATSRPSARRRTTASRRPDR